MPRFNGTGPLGCGPRTGCGMGPCGAGIGWRRGRGRGVGRFFGIGKYSAEDEKEDLSDYERCLKEELKAVQNRLEELEK